MTGDNMMTDITFGNGAKVGTLCVLTGVSSENDVLVSDGLRKPMFYSESLGTMKEWWIVDVNIYYDHFIWI